MIRRLLARSYPYLFMALLYSAFSWRFFEGRSALNIFPDNEWFLGPVFSFGSAALRSFEWPLWMNTVLGGIPLYNSPQISAYYPFYFLFLDIWSTPLQSLESLHRITLLHIAILQVNAYILFRTLGLAKPSAILGVTFIVFNLTTLEIMKWTHLIASYSWLPLYLAGLLKLLDAPWRPSAILMTTGGFAMMAYAMVGQPLILAGILTIVIATGRLLIHDKCHTPASLRNLATLAVTLLVAILVSAMVVVPVVADLGNMIRWVSSTHAVVGNAPIPFEHFLTDQLSPGEIFSFVLPGGNRHDIAHPYVGALPVLFALTALISRNQHWIILPLALMALYSFLSAFGDHFGLAQVNYRIPVVNKIREPSYFLIPFNISIGLLAAIGFDSLFRRAIASKTAGADRPFFRLLLLAPFAIASLAAYLIFKTNAPVVMFFLACLAFAVCVYPVFSPDHRAAITGLGVLFVFSIFVQLMTVNWKSPRISDSDYLRLNVVKLETAVSRVGELDPDRRFRVIFGGGINSQMAAMLASYHGLRTLNSYVNPLPVSQFNEMYHHGARNDSYGKGLGAKYLLCHACTAEETRGYRFFETVAGHSIYVADDALPRFYTTANLVGRVTELNEYISILTANELRSFPLILRPDDFPEFIRNGQEGNCQSRKELDSLNVSSFVVHCENAAFFVLNEFFSDAWRVSVNGDPVQPRKVNGNQIGVRVAPGSSVIRMTYEPMSIRVSLALLSAGILGLLLIVFRSHLIGKKARILQSEARP